MSGEVCTDCARAMPPQVTGPLAQAAFEKMTHLGIQIRDQLGSEWYDVYLELESSYLAMVEAYTPERFTQ